MNYTLQRATNYDDDWWIFDPDLNKGPAGFDRTHNFTAAVIYELPFGHEQALRHELDRRDRRRARRLAVEHQRVHPERHAVQRHLSRRRAGPRHRLGRSERPSRSDRRSRRAEDAGRVVQRGADRIEPAAPSAGRPAARSATSGATRCAGPASGRSTRRCSRTSDRPGDGGSRSASRRSTSSTTSTSANPDGQIGVPGNDNPNAGPHHRYGGQLQPAQLPVRVQVSVLAAGGPAQRGRLTAAASAIAADASRLLSDKLEIARPRASRITQPGAAVSVHRLRRS